MSSLFVIDGAKALRSAITEHLRQAPALIHRCQVHKERNVLEHLPRKEGLRPRTRRALQRRLRHHRPRARPQTARAPGQLS